MTKTQTQWICEYLGAHFCNGTVCHDLVHLVEQGIFWAQVWPKVELIDAQTRWS